MYLHNNGHKTTSEEASDNTSSETSRVPSGAQLGRHPEECFSWVRALNDEMSRKLRRININGQSAKETALWDAELQTWAHRPLC